MTLDASTVSDPGLRKCAEGGSAAPPARKVRPVALAATLLLMFAAQGLALALPGKLLITQMEADVLHLLDGLSRIAAGQTAHIDFSTPLGPLAFLPITAWDASPARAMALGNVAAMAATLPILAWLHVTRLSFGQTVGLGAMAMVLAAAATWSPDSYAHTFAMHYNRWGWALFIVAAPLLVIPPRDGPPAQRADLGDGIAIGAAGAALACLKITYAAALAAVWLVWLLSTRRWRAAAVAAAACAAAIVATAAASGGAEGLAAYLGDLWGTATSEVRPSPGRRPAQVASTPYAAPISIGLLVATLVLAKGGLRKEALAFGATSLAIVAIAWQNFGNHAMGALLAAPVLLALAPRADASARAFGAPAPTVLRTLAAGLFFAQLHLLFAFERSVFGGWVVDDEKHVALFADRGAPGLIFQSEVDSIRGIRPVADGEEPDERARDFRGRSFPGCSIFSGYQNQIADIGGALAAAPSLAGRPVLTGDLTNPVWWAAGAPPQEGAQLWRYRPLGSSLDKLDLFAVPLCPADVAARNRLIDEIAEDGPAMRVALEIPGWVVFEPAPAGAALNERE